MRFAEIQISKLLRKMVLLGFFAPNVAESFTAVQDIVIFENGTAPTYVVHSRRLLIHKIAIGLCTKLPAL
jgi:hypothetical protein